MGRKDISDILSDWPFDPDILNVRRITGDDNKEKIQLRLDLGLLQMEAEGRPDGARPHGYENYLQYCQAEQEHIENEEKGVFVLSSEDLRELQQESIQYYHRYLCFAELKDHEDVIKDTAHNLAVLEFVEQYAEDEESAWSFLQYYPYVEMMNIQAKVRIAMDEEEYSSALRSIENSIQLIKDFNKKWGISESKDSTREIRILREWKETVLQKRPISASEKLQQELDEAIQLEHYERAAKIRDKLEQLQEKES